jgi:hypothetical protein
MLLSAFPAIFWLLSERIHRCSMARLTRGVCAQTQFLIGHIKVNNKVNNLGNSVKISHEGQKVRVGVSVPVDDDDDDVVVVVLWLVSTGDVCACHCTGDVCACHCTGDVCARVVVVVVVRFDNPCCALIHCAHRSR